jgi:hypothetical protein
MTSNDTIKRYYLKRLAEYRRAGYSDSAAASAAAADTKAKYGRIPG